MYVSSFTGTLQRQSFSASLFLSHTHTHGNSSSHLSGKPAHSDHSFSAISPLIMSTEQQIDKINGQLKTYDFVRFTWTDVHGINRGKTLPARNAHRFLKKGTGIYAGWCIASI